MFKSNLYFL